MQKISISIVWITLFILPGMILANTSEKRLALVIGNKDYMSSPLANSMNNATSMEAALKDCNFDVICRLNVNEQEMFEAIREFGKRLKSVDVGLFYYAGHGVQIKGVNYLVPINADIEAADEIPSKCIDASLVTSKMETAGNRLNMIILDACRMNPFQSFQLNSRGLAAMKAPVGSIIQYAAEPGTLAIEDQKISGNIGLYTSKLLKNIQKPGLNILDMFQQVRTEVYQASQKKQTPCEFSSQLGKFYFKPLPAEVTAGTNVKNESKKDLEQLPKQSFTNKLGMTFVRIPAGIFMMGSPENEPGRDDDEAQHKVALTQDYFMQTTEVTQGQWKALMGSNPSHFLDCGDDCPVENVSWDDVQSFLKQLNSMGIEHTYRLPTEAEWEYAARANTTTAYAFGNCLSSNEANYNANYPPTGCSIGHFREKSIAVGSLQKNAWGLYDMHGNVWEWCQDFYGNYPKGSFNNPTGPYSGTDCVIRGGSWIDTAKGCRSADRNRCGKDFALRHLGFRLCTSDH